MSIPLNATSFTSTLFWNAKVKASQDGAKAIDTLFPGEVVCIEHRMVAPRNTLLTLAEHRQLFPDLAPTESEELVKKWADPFQLVSPLRKEPTESLVSWGETTRLFDRASFGNAQTTYLDIIDFFQDGRVLLVFEAVIMLNTLEAGDPLLLQTPLDNHQPCQRASTAKSYMVDTVVPTLLPYIRPQLIDYLYTERGYRVVEQQCLLSHGLWLDDHGTLNVLKDHSTPDQARSTFEKVRSQCQTYLETLCPTIASH
jgi:hypothetical protein